MKTTKLLLFITIFLINTINAQHEYWAVYDTTVTGWPTNNLYKIAGDNNNNMWIASDAGLIRFTNGSFEVFDTTNSPIPTNDIKWVYVDKSDNVWLVDNTGEYGSFLKYDGQTWSKEDTNQSCIPNSIHEFVIEGQLKVFIVGTAEEKHLFIYNGFDCLLLANHAHSHQLRISNSLKIAHLSFYYNTSEGSEVAYTDGNQWYRTQTYSYGYPFPDLPIYNSIAFDDLTGDLWAYSGKLHKMSLPDLEHLRSIPGGPGYPVRISELLIEQSNYFWLLYWKGLNENSTKLYLYNNKKSFWKTFDSTNSPLPYRFQGSLARDGNGRLYIATYDWYNNNYASGLFVFNKKHLTSVENNVINISDYSLKQNYPNPFNPTTTIEYSLSKASDVKLIIYNSLGEEIKTLVNEEQSVGPHSIKFDGSNFTSGVYFYQLNAGDHKEVKKMVLMK